MTNTDKDLKTLEMVYDALDSNRVKVFYQPQFNAETCDLVSAEALCRIVNEYGELVLPGAFIPLMESQETPEVIRTFDLYIFTKVCRFLCRMRKRGMRQIPISVNLSRKHLLTEPAELYLADTADRHSIPHKFIELEITESAAEDDPVELSRLIYKLRMQGFRVAIDDFGIGRSNFRFLIDNPVDVLKLDKSFIAGKCDDRRERLVVSRVIRMAKELGLTVVAEGVEETRQWTFLRECGCDLIQGNYASEPLAEDEFIDFFHCATGDI